MGALFLHHNDSKVDRALIEKIYSEKRFSEPRIAHIGDYTLYLYRKQLIKADNFFYREGDAVFACGSLFYKSLGYNQSLEQLLEDFLNGSLDREALFGNFALIFYSSENKTVTFFTDGAVTKNLYFDNKRKILSTDLLAFLETDSGTYTLNRNAVIENLTTGNLISPDTYINEVRRIDKCNIGDLGKWFPGVSFDRLVTGPSPCPADFDAAVKDANERIEHYFRSAKSLTDQYGAHIGLTGGLDSRLLLIHAGKQLSRLITNSFWRPDSGDYINASRLARQTALEFVSFENDPFMKPSEKEMIDSSLYFFDGQVRSQNIWTEEFNQRAYSMQIAAGHYAGFHGCGGEQYRNAEKITRKIAVDDYIRYDWMFKQCDNLFTDKKLLENVHEKIREKIIRLTGISERMLGLEEIKRIQNEVWITANRMTRVNVLNQQQFYFAPFTEYCISQQAYNYIPFLGSSFDFQLAMINMSDKELAGVMTNYGYPADRGEPLKHRLLPIVTGLVPRKLFYLFYNSIRKRQNGYSDFIPGDREFLSLKSATGDDIDLVKLSRNKNLGGMLKAMNAFLGLFYGHENMIRG